MGFSHKQSYQGREDKAADHEEKPLFAVAVFDQGRVFQFVEGGHVTQIGIERYLVKLDRIVGYASFLG